VTAPQVTPAEAKKHLRRLLEDIEKVRWQLIGIEKSLYDPFTEPARHEDMSDELDEATELRTVIACVLEDSIRTAIQDLRDALASLEDEEDEEEREP
jgi:hypothetical protein